MKWHCFLFLPSIKALTYTPGYDVKKDLVRITHSRASIISKQWLQNILKTFVILGQQHILLENNEPSVNKINQLEQYIQENRETYDYYLAWIPPSLPPGRKDVLSIVVCQEKNGCVVLKQIVPSPFWSSEQISSMELKKSIDATYQNINMMEFYTHDARIKYEWYTWHIN
jgi:hypothetical protein